MTERLSRRGFARLLGVGFTLAAVPMGERALALAAAASGAAPVTPASGAAPALVRLSANENPYGPPPAALAAIPASTTVLVDEAYHHFASGGGYESVIAQVAQRPNLVVARTFSKIYGMAGLRCGYAVAQPALVARLRREQAWDSMNVVSLA